MDAMSAGTITGRSNGQQGERARLRKNFRDWILRYVCNAAAAPSSAEDAPNTASCSRMAIDLRQIGNELGVPDASEGSVQQAPADQGQTPRRAERCACLGRAPSFATMATFPKTQDELFF
jgi:hypothetical protein